MRLWPSPANSSARARPMPSVAPVITTAGNARLGSDVRLVSFIAPNPVSRSKHARLKPDRYRGSQYAKSTFPREQQLPSEIIRNRGLCGLDFLRTGLGTFEPMFNETGVRI